MIIGGVKYCGPGGEGAYRRRHEVQQQADKYKVARWTWTHARYHHTHASLHGMHSRLEIGSWSPAPWVGYRGPGPAQFS